MLRRCTHCRYVTFDNSNLNKHIKTCKVRKRVEAEAEAVKRQVETVSANDMGSTANEVSWLRGQIAEKDKQIAELIDRVSSSGPITNNTNHNTLNQTNNINLLYPFGDQRHNISDETLIELLKVPEDSISKLLALRFGEQEGRNVIIPNVRDNKRAKIATRENGQMKWKRVNTDEIMFEMWDDNRGILEPVVDENTRIGQRWSNWANRVDNDHPKNGPAWRELENKMMNTVIDASRS